jgi:PPK2 family polyphosphate:nucleotide phosphotransferase
MSKNKNKGKDKAPRETHDTGTPAEAPAPALEPITYPNYRVAPGMAIKLQEVDPEQSEFYQSKEEVEDALKAQRERLADLQERLYAEHRKSVLIVLQAMDTGGKDGTIRGVFDGVNPQGCQVWSFKVPSEEELAHDYLWRHHIKTPPRGMIAIFNRSHYENVLVVRVHNLVPEDVWSRRYSQINDWERMLCENGTVILKFFLHISKDEQKDRLQSRLDNADKRWKFAVGDLPERALWDQYMAAYEDAISKCSTPYAPWYVIPANKKWYRNLVVARTIADTIDALNPQFPKPEEDLSKVLIKD